MIVKKRNVIVTIFFVLILCLFSACAKEEENSKNKKEPEIIKSSAMFIEGYDNIASLTANSEKIAIVKVLDDGKCEMMETGSPCTFNQVEVMEPIYNCEKGDIINHLTPGGEYEGKLYISNEVKQLVKGEEYLLFMSNVGHDWYRDLNYDWGRFLYKDGKITHVRYQEKDQGGLFGLKDYDFKTALETVKFVINSPASVSLNNTKVEYQSWDQAEENYNSWEKLVRESDVICTATISDFTLTGAEENYDYFPAMVDQVFWGSPETSIKLITYNALYGEKEKTLKEYIDDPWMSAGGQYLLFLKKDEESSMYRCVGRSQGRFTLKDGKITSLKNLYPERIKKGMDIEDMPLTQWGTEVRGAEK